MYKEYYSIEDNRVKGILRRRKEQMAYPSLFMQPLNVYPLTHIRKMRIHQLHMTLFEYE
jgi:hypothetical protein